MPFPTQIQSSITVYNSKTLTPAVYEGVFFNARYGADLAARGIKTSDRVKVSILGTPDINKGDYIVRGAADVTPSTSVELRELFGYENVFTVTDIADNRFGSEHMRHVAITAK